MTKVKRKSLIIDLNEARKPMTDLELTELAVRRAAARLRDHKRGGLAEIFEYLADELAKLKKQQEKKHAKND